MKVLALAVLLGLLAAGAPQAAEQPLRSRLCPEDLPEDVRLPPRAGCDAAPGRPTPRRDGFHDLGNGTTVQIGGRTAVEFGARR